MILTLFAVQGLTALDFVGRLRDSIQRDRSEACPTCDIFEMYMTADGLRGTLVRPHARLHGPSA